MPLGRIGCGLVGGVWKARVSCEGFATLAAGITMRAEAPNDVGGGTALGVFSGLCALHPSCARSLPFRVLPLGAASGYLVLREGCELSAHSCGCPRHYLGLCKPCDFKCRSSCRFGYQLLGCQKGIAVRFLKACSLNISRSEVLLLPHLRPSAEPPMEEAKEELLETGLRRRSCDLEVAEACRS